MSSARPALSLPSPERLRELFVYDSETGELMWRTTGRGRRLDRKILAKQKGYLAVGIDGRVHRVHRVVWAIVHGAWPPEEIDHKNGIRADNRISNLRGCAHLKNCQNTKAKRPNKLKGAFFHKRSGLYQSMIFVDGQYTPLGYYKTALEAHRAYAAAAEKYFKDFARAA